MNKKGSASIQRGQAITFRLPSDTPDHIIKQLQKLKETERRNFSSKMAEFILEGVNNSLTKDRETVTLPLPKQLSKDQRDWLKHAHSEALLGSIVYQLLADPIRATSILASLNSNALDINEALYLQENAPTEIEHFYTDLDGTTDIDQEKPKMVSLSVKDDLDNDLENFDWEQARQELATAEEENQDNEETDDVDDLLGGFLANMNK